MRAAQVVRLDRELAAERARPREPTVVERVVEKEVPKVKEVPFPVEKEVQVPVEKERLVTQQVPVERIVEVPVERLVEVPIEKVVFVEKGQPQSRLSAQPAAPNVGVGLSLQRSSRVRCRPSHPSARGCGAGPSRSVSASCTLQAFDCLPRQSSRMLGLAGSWDDHSGSDHSGLRGGAQRAVRGGRHGARHRRCAVAGLRPRRHQEPHHRPRRLGCHHRVLARRAALLGKFGPATARLHRRVKLRRRQCAREQPPVFDEFAAGLLQRPHAVKLSPIDVDFVARRHSVSAAPAVCVY